MNRNLERILGILLAGAALYLVADSLFAGWQFFLASCPNKDLLQWDGNLRFSLAVDHYQDLRQGRFGAFLSSYLGANTWPLLRGTISLILFGIFQPSTVLDASISLFFYGLLFLSLLYISVRLMNSVFKGAGVFSVLAFMLLHTEKISAYSMASMLETQGMFFLLWTTYFSIRMYQELYPRSARLFEMKSFSNLAMTDINRREGDKRIRPVLAFGLGLSILGLVFTKYPYAIMLFMAILLVEILRNPLDFVAFAREVILEHYLYVRAVIFGLLGLGAFVLILKFGMKAKPARYGFYLFSLILFVDFSIFAFKRASFVRSLLPASMRYFFVCGIFPALVWIFLHPDRLGTIVGGGIWKPGAAFKNVKFFESSFFQPLFGTVFDHSLLVVAVFVFGLGTFLLYGFLLFRRFERNEAIDAGGRWRSILGAFIRHPFASALVMVALQFILQEFLSPNKQERHIFHLLPALLLMLLIWVFTGPEVIFKKYSSLRRFHAFVLVLLTAGGGFFLAGQKGGALSADYLNSRFLCYSGYEDWVFTRGRWPSEQLTLDKNYVLMNLRAQEQARAEVEIVTKKLEQHPDLLLHPSRVQLSEMNLLLRMRSLKDGGMLREDSRFHFKKWEEFGRLLVISIDCDRPWVQQKVQARAKKAGVQLKEVQTWKRPAELEPPANANPGLCMREYDILRPGL